MTLSPGRKTAWAALGVVAVAGALGVETSLDAKVDPRTYDLKKKVLGQSAGQWTAQWWQWVYSMPASVNPWLDNTSGKYTMVGQRGPVWFLGGTSGFDTADRTATIPSGKALLVNLYTVEWDALDPTTQTVAQMRTAAAKYIDSYDATQLAVTIDGVAVSGVSKMRIVSPVFEYTTPDDGLYAYTGQNFPGGIYKPAVSDGYWVFLKPLSVGSHVLNVEEGVGRFTYHLTVVDHDQP